MDFNFTTRTARLPTRSTRNFLVDNLGEDWNGIVPDDYFTDENWKTIRNLTGRLVDQGWLTLAWPEEYGGQGRPHIEQMIYNEETAYFRAPTRDTSMGTHMVGPSIMLYGSPMNRRRASCLRSRTAQQSIARGSVSPNRGLTLHRCSFAQSRMATTLFSAAPRYGPAARSAPIAAT